MKVCDVSCGSNSYLKTIWPASGPETRLIGAFKMKEGSIKYKDGSAGDGEERADPSDPSLDRGDQGDADRPPRAGDVVIFRLKTVLSE